MDIRLGMEVRSSDGMLLGTVDRIILEPDTRAVFGIIAHKGHVFSQDRVVETTFIERTADDKVQLRLTADKANDLPRFVEHEYVVPTAEELRSLPYPMEGGVSGAGATVFPLMWRSTYTGHDYKPASRSFLDSSTVDAQSIAILSNLPDGALMVGKGTDVITSDGGKIGKVVDILYLDGTMTGIVIRTGMVRHHHLTVPVNEIESITTEHVRLRTTMDDIQRYVAAPTTSVGDTTS